ncbi:MAG: cytochrome c oxidase assembly protein [Bacteroidota bacterium]
MPFHPPAPRPAWNLDLPVLIPLAAFGLLYMVGALRAWRRAGRGHGLTLWQFARFLGALLALVIALLSPLDALSESLFSAHMLQHQILMIVAAPLLSSSGFSLAFLWALPRPGAQGIAHLVNRYRLLPSVWKRLSHPLSAWFLFGLAQWLWHASWFYQLALQHEAVHILEHLSFLLTAMLFWWVLFRPAQDRTRYALAIPYLFTTSLHSAMLSALITFSSSPWYPFYAARAAAWGLSPLQDQQLAGLLMWIPGGTVFSLLTIGYFAAWLRALEQRSAGVARLK